MHTRVCITIHYLPQDVHRGSMDGADATG